MEIKDLISLHYGYVLNVSQESFEKGLVNFVRFAILFSIPITCLFSVAYSLQKKRKFKRKSKGKHD